MSNEPKGTGALQAQIAKEFRNMKTSPGLEMGLRPELGTFELCDNHYDASRTESEEHCAVCKLEAELDRMHRLYNATARLRDDYGDALTAARAERDTLREAATKVLNREERIDSLAALLENSDE